MAQDIEIKIKAILESAEASKNIDDLKDALQELESIAENVDLSPDELNNLGGAIDNLSGKVQQSEVSLQNFQSGIQTVKASGDLLAGSISTLVGGLATLGIENEYITNLTQGAAGAVALSSGVSQAGKAIVKLSQNTKIASVAQRAFNIVANANPYLLAVTALAATAGAIALIASSLDESAKAQEISNESTQRGIDLRKQQIDVEESFAKILATNTRQRLTAELNAANARLQLLEEEAKFIVENASTIEDANERINKVEDEKTKIRQARVGIEIALQREVNNLELANFEQREKLLAAEGASEKTLFNARVTTLNETIRLFGAESDEGIRAARELEVVRAQFATNQKTRKQEAVEDNKDEKESIDAIIESNRQLAEERSELIANIEAIENEFEDSQLTRQQREENVVRDKYFAIIEAAREAGLEITTLEAAQEAELKAIRDAGLNERVEQEIAAAQQIAQAETDLQNAKISAAQSGFELLGVLAGENEKIQKALFLASKAVAAGEIISNSIATSAELKARGLIGATQLANPLTAIQGAATIAAVTKGLLINKISTAASLASLAATTISGLGGGNGPQPSLPDTGGGSFGGGGSAQATFSPQQFFGLGQGNIDPNAGPQGDTRVFVVESDITNTQNRVSVIEDRSRIG